MNVPCGVLHLMHGIESLPLPGREGKLTELS